MTNPSPHSARRTLVALLAVLPGALLVLLGAWGIAEALLYGHHDPHHGGGYVLIGGVLFLVSGLVFTVLAIALWPRVAHKSGPAA